MIADERFMLQELYADDPWRLIVSCILLNQTTRRQVDRVRGILFAMWPSPDRMAQADTEQLATVLHPLGFFNQRADRLKKLSLRWCELQAELGFCDWDEEVLAALPGVGPYALDSYRIFHLNDLSRCDSGDKEIMAWLAREGEL